MMNRYHGTTAPVPAQPKVAAGYDLNLFEAGDVHDAEFERF